MEETPTASERATVCAGRAAEVKIARLKASEVDRYEMLHRDYPPEYRRYLCVAGYEVLDIYRAGLTLVMIVAMGRPAPDFVPDAALERAWHSLTQGCFETPWESAGLIFDFGPGR